MTANLAGTAPPPLGFDACIDYREANLSQARRVLAGGGAVGVADLAGGPYALCLLTARLFGSLIDAYAAFAGGKILGKAVILVG